MKQRAIDWSFLHPLDIIAHFKQIEIRCRYNNNLPTTRSSDQKIINISSCVKKTAPINMPPKFPRIEPAAPWLCEFETHCFYCRNRYTV